MIIAKLKTCTPRLSQITILQDFLTLRSLEKQRAGVISETVAQLV